MNAFSLLLLSTALVTTKANQHRAVQVQELDQLSHHRRLLLQESTCTLYQKCAMLLPTDEDPNIRHECSWVCKLSKEDAQKLSVQYVDIAESESIPAIANASSGEFTFTMSEAIVDTDSPRMFIPDHASVEVHKVDNFSSVHQNTRAGDARPSVTGTKRTLVVRVTDRNGVQPTAILV